jgi:DNA-binding NarL/FixJ family response regulator
VVYRVMIVEGHPLLQSALVELFNGEKDFRAVAAAGNARGALEVAARRELDLVVLETRLSDASEIDLIQRLLQRASCAILVFTAQGDALTRERALRSGARGYLLKSSSPTEVLAAARAVLRGDVSAKDRWAGEGAGRAPRSVSPTRAPAVPLRAIERLSRRETEVFALLGDGLAPRHVAQHLGLSVSTVEVYRQQIRRKLQIADSAALTRLAVAWSRDGTLASPMHGTAAGRVDVPPGAGHGPSSTLATLR